MGNYTRPNNVLASSTICPLIVWCTTIPEEQPARSDHMPIVTVIQAPSKVQTDTARPNYRAG